MTTIREIQSQLNKLGFGPLVVDGLVGASYQKAVKEFQKVNRLLVDGDAGPATLSELFPRPLYRKTASTNPSAATSWPFQKNRVSFYGNPGNVKCTQGVVTLKANLVYDGSPVKTFRCHNLCEDSFQAIFDETLFHYGESTWRKLRLDVFGGCYNLRKMRGGTSWSDHAFGAAVDLDPERNSLHSNKTKASFAKPEYVPFWNIVEAHGAVSLGREKDYDWMHFGFVRF